MWFCICSVAVHPVPERKAGGDPRTKTFKITTKHVDFVDEVDPVDRDGRTKVTSALMLLFFTIHQEDVDGDTGDDAESTILTTLVGKRQSLRHFVVLHNFITRYIRRLSDNETPSYRDEI